MSVLSQIVLRFIKSNMEGVIVSTTDNRIKSRLRSSSARNLKARPILNRNHSISNKTHRNGYTRSRNIREKSMNNININELVNDNEVNTGIGPLANGNSQLWSGYNYGPFTR
ncbi:hypothetical protein WA026_018171 [Henosepilachna vigintioctopunctata]|uniref:Uncharacterized protein n=1 Tax=Henosepilachna vigintioctopunctata TaxID=420089 RepID=A0AAW1UEB5_9CUCU